MEQPVRYCITEDGVRIAYNVLGDGPPLFFVHYIYAFSHSHFVPSYDGALRRIGRGRQFIRCDMRGTGLSQRDIPDLSPAAAILDMEAVVRDLGLSRFTLMGAAAGGLRAIEYAARHPDQVAALVLYEAFPRLQDAFPRPVLEAISQLCRADWQLATRTMADAGIRRLDESEGLRWAEMTQASTTGETMARLIDEALEHDVTQRLSSIQCPTLVCHSRNDPIWPFAAAQRMADAIPDARMVHLDDAFGGAFVQPDSAVEAIDSFLLEMQDAEPPPAPVAGPRGGKALTPRETEILILIANGLTSKEISNKLSLSIRTVGRHITNIYDKIGARGRADATSYAHRRGLTER